jgi:hypothetical protein
MDIKQINRAILTGGFTNDELRSIYDTTKLAWRNNSIMATRQFAPKDKVKFTGRRGITYTGEVIKVNIKNVKVLTTTGIRFNVLAAMLEMA